MSGRSGSVVFPAEWAPHRATWIAWPHHAEDWPGVFPQIDEVYVAITRALAGSEHVEILCHTEVQKNSVQELLSRGEVSEKAFTLHLVPNNRSWLRDSAPTAVRTQGGALQWMDWKFNAWAKYDNFDLDRAIPDYVSDASRIPSIQALWPNQERVVLEGGGIETDGEGTLIVTEEWLLSDTQVRNPGRTWADYEAMFRQYLGIEKTIWLGSGIAGDDTHGHVDDVCRFVTPGKVVLAFEPDKSDVNYACSQDNLQRLERETDARGRAIEVVCLPMPKPIFCEGERMPASYANFYIANKAVLVPVFDDPEDSRALEILSLQFPERKIIPIPSRDLVFGQGTIHCLTQQEPSSYGAE